MSGSGTESRTVVFKRSLKYQTPPLTVVNRAVSPPWPRRSNTVCSSGGTVTWRRGTTGELGVVGVNAGREDAVVSPSVFTGGPSQSVPRSGPPVSVSSPTRPVGVSLLGSDEDGCEETRTDFTGGDRLRPLSRVAGVSGPTSSSLGRWSLRVKGRWGGHDSPTQTGT